MLSIFNGDFPCKTPLLIPLSPNSSVIDVITPCFALVFLPTILAFFSLACLGFLMFYGSVILAPQLLKTKLLYTKALLSFLITLAAFGRLILALLHDWKEAPKPVIGGLAVFIIAVSSFASYLRCWNNGIPSSIWLHLVYFLRLITAIPEVILVTNSPKPEFSTSVLLGIESISLFFLTFLFCFADKYDCTYENFYTLKDINPDRTSSSLSKAFFSYAGYLLSKGSKGALTYDVFWALDNLNQPENLATRYFKYFESEKLKIHQNRLISWLLLIVVKCNWIHIAASISLGFLFSMFTVSDPVFLQLIIQSNENHYPLWWGFGIVVVTFFATFMRFSLSARSDYYSQIVYVNVQSILVNAIYRKMLKLTAQAKAKYSSGHLNNLMTMDISMIRAFILSIPDIIFALVTMSTCIVCLYFVIGYSVFFGVAILAVFLPVNNLIFRKLTTYQIEQMRVKDQRQKLMADILSGIKVFKLYAWEESMKAIIAEQRNQEIKMQKYMLYCTSIVGIAFNAYPIVATILSFVGYVVIQGNPMTPQVAFLTLMLFNLMRLSVYAIPGLIQQSINAKISIKRIQDFLLEDEILEIENSAEPSFDDTIFKLDNASFSWTKPNPEEASILPTLKSLSLEIRQGEFIGVIGRVGAGKSSALNALCKQLYQLFGSFYRKPSISIAYVPQEPFIENLTLRDNILFGAPLNEALYHQTIEACALRDDLKMLISGDMTEIGERGINLSGGQKARVALARAVYRNSDLYILDDTLSAVDSHVGAHIFEHVIGNTGVLKGKTRIFALNSISFLPQCDRIVVMKEGTITDIGTFDELNVRQNPTFLELVKELATKEEHQAEDDEAIAEMEDDVLNQPGGLRQSLSSDTPAGARRRRKQSSMSVQSTSPNEDARLIQEEEVRVGKVSYKMYFDYIKAFGIGLAVTYFLTLFIVRTFLESFSQVWMAKWSSEYGNSTDFTAVESLIVYGAFSMVSTVVIGLSFIMTSWGAYNASKRLHEDLLYSLLRSPMTFFDSTPMGRILNRTSKDIEDIDFSVCAKLRMITKLIADAVFYTVSAMYVMPQLGLLIIPAVIIAVVVVRYYGLTSVQIRRLCSKSWSNVTSHAQESYVGAANIRIFEVQPTFIQQMVDKIIVTAESKLAENVMNRWIQLHMDTLTAAFSALFTLGAIYLGNVGSLSPGAVALVASTGTMLRGLLGETARQTNNLEMTIVSVERVQEYIDNEHEADWTSVIPPAFSWPAKGRIIFKDFSLRYRPTSPIVLKNLNLEINAGEKIGIVGRTGAGKSSLTMALFRMIEPASGTIYIDNTDFRTLGLHELRRALTIIPQDPVLFCGTLRVNLDPFSEHSDATLWDAIDKAHLRPFVDAFPEKLNHGISEGGGNLSVGQRQLVCLARAILRQKTRILILDEATAAVDVETDQLIQESIRSQFNNCTILTIAHRLNTIMDYDKVLVMDAGEIREFDTPSKLLENKTGLFYSLASQAKIV